MFPEQALGAPSPAPPPLPEGPPNYWGPDLPYKHAMAASLLSRGLPLDLLRYPDQALGAIVADASRYAMDTSEGPVRLVSFSEEGNGCEAGCFVSLQIGDDPRPVQYTADAADPHRMALAVILSALGLPRTLLATPRDIPLAVLDAAILPRS